MAGGAVIGRRLRALPGLVAGAPPWSLVLVGAVVTVLGANLLVRPLSALEVLGYYVGASCVLSGLGDLLGQRGERRDRVVLVQGVAWLVAGLAVVVWIGRSIELLGPFVAVLLIVSGSVSVVALVRDRSSAAVLRALFGASETAWGVMALWWPDVTLLVVAVLFGARTAAFGVALVWRGARGDRAVSRHAPPSVPAIRWASAVLVLAVAVAGLYVSNLFRAGLPVLDDFYDAPASVPAEPGRLVRSEPYDGDLPAGLTAYRFLYTTTASDGSPALASGVLAVPEEPSAEPAPLIAWAHGTVGVARACAPSLGRAAISTEGMPAMDALAERGWAMVATDYTGMGAEGEFPYLVGAGEAYSVLDSVRAAREVPGVRLADQSILWGHSQGGHAALWAGQLASSYAPDAGVVGTAALSPAADPLGLAEVVTANPGVPGASLGIAFVADAYTRTYGVALDALVAPSALTIVREAASRCTGEGGTLFTILGGLAIARDQPILREPPGEGPLADRLAENVPTGPWAAPLFVAQGTADEVIPVRLTEAWIPRACASGATLTFSTYDGGTHMSVLEPDAPLSGQLEQWTVDRFAGVSAPTDCSIRSD
ncbi:hypothetical protein GCM10012276_32370 [Nocardioides deserti]|nr:hypothetical protein GCM10012276_32370 [Nocardioides deserti]